MRTVKLDYRFFIQPCRNEVISIYQKLIDTLAAKNMSVYALSKKTGIGNNHLYRALGGHTTLFPGWKKRIAEALDCTVEDLFSDENEELNNE